MIATTLAVVFAVIGIAAGVLTCIALPWAAEPNAPKGIAAAPAAITVVCLVVSAGLFFGV